MRVDQERVRQLALSIAADYGDPAPTGLYWTEATRAEAARFLGGGVGDLDDGSEPQIVVLLIGTFVAPVSRGIQGSSGNLSGSWITLAVRADYRVTDFGIGHSPMSGDQLAEIGVVRSLIHHRGSFDR